MGWSYCSNGPVTTREKNIVKPEGRRKRGRPKLRCEDGVQSDIEAEGEKLGKHSQD
jgi:hypothetical protein